MLKNRLVLFKRFEFAEKSVFIAGTILTVNTPSCPKKKFRLFVGFGSFGLDEVPIYLSGP